MTSQIYTTEPMITRALGAEIRNEAGRFKRLLQSHLKGDPRDHGEVSLLTCEGPERLDLYIEFSQGSIVTRVGIEAKLDHAISPDQLDRQRRQVDYLFLLVLEDVDADDHRAAVDGVLTWADSLACFERSRITLEDVKSLPASKVQIERMLRSTDPVSKFPSDWYVAIARGGSGMPSIVIESPSTREGRGLRGQVQVCGRGMPRTLDDARVEFHIGTAVDDTIRYYPAPDPHAAAPSWIHDLDLLERAVLRDRVDEYRISRRAGGRANGPLGPNRKAIVQKHLSGRTWLAKGYRDWALGPKSEPQTLDQLPWLVATAAEIFTRWFDAISAFDSDPRI